VIIRPQDFYILAVKLLVLITFVPALAGFVGGLFRIRARTAFVLGAGWWALVEIAVVVERGKVLFWKELFWITSQYYRPTLELIVGLVGLVFSVMLAGSTARAFFRMGNRLSGLRSAGVERR